jgi:uncharacterized membrane protein
MYPADIVIGDSSYGVVNLLITIFIIVFIVWLILYFIRRM